jgi:hypothetical protein
MDHSQVKQQLIDQNNQLVDYKGLAPPRTRQAIDSI